MDALLDDAVFFAVRGIFRRPDRPPSIPMDGNRNLGLIDTDGVDLDDVEARRFQQ